jgi:plasmid maintenance system antidote protein VapI
MFGMTKTVNTLRQAVLDSGESRHRIGQGSAMSPSQLSRLVSRERGLTIETAERLATYLGLEIVVRPKGRARTRKAK